LVRNIWAWALKKPFHGKKWYNLLFSVDQNGNNWKTRATIAGSAVNNATYTTKVGGDIGFQANPAARIQTNFAGEEISAQDVFNKIMESAPRTTKSKSDTSRQSSNTSASISSSRFSIGSNHSGQSARSSSQGAKGGSRKSVGRKPWK
jgi:hypothetical protein